MKNRLILLLLAAAFVNVQGFSQTAFWDVIYQNNQDNPNNSNVKGQLRMHPNGDLMLLDYYIPNFSEAYVRVMRYDGNAWNQVGNDVPALVFGGNNDRHVDFVITPNGNMYLGMADSLFTYNSSTQLWDPQFIPNYHGGLCTDDSSKLYYIHREEGNSGIVYSDLHLAEFSSGTAQLFSAIALDLQMIPVKTAESNRIIIRNGMFYISTLAQSTNYVYTFKGDTINGFARMEAGNTLPSLTQFISMETDSNGTLMVAMANSGSNPNALRLYTYDTANDSYVPFDTTGLAVQSASRCQLARNPQGEMHLIYASPYDAGFLFKHGNNGWEHIGPKIVGSAAPSNCQMVFEPNSGLHFVEGTGAPTLAMRVRKIANDLSTAEENTIETMQLHPNPAAGFVTLTLSEFNVKSAYEIFTITGQKVSSGLIESQSVTIPVNNLPNGIYYLRTNESTQATPFIVAN
jgi:hypothetical protein